MKFAVLYIAYHRDSWGLIIIEPEHFFRNVIFQKCAWSYVVRIISTEKKDSSIALQI